MALVGVQIHCPNIIIQCQGFYQPNGGNPPQETVAMIQILHILFLNILTWRGNFVLAPNLTKFAIIENGLLSQRAMK